MNLWALKGFRVEWIANFNSLKDFGEFVNELVVDAFMDEYACACATRLPVVEPIVS